MAIGGRREAPEERCRVIRMEQSSQEWAGRGTKRAVGSEEHSEWVGGLQTARTALCIHEETGDQDHAG